MDYNFTPQGATVSIAVGAASANVEVVPGDDSVINSVRVVNLGDNVAFIEFGGDDTVEATEADSMPILPGTVESFAVTSTPVLWVAALGDGSTLYITPGSGI